MCKEWKMPPLSTTYRCDTDGRRPTLAEMLDGIDKEAWPVDEESFELLLDVFGAVEASDDGCN